MRGVNNQIRYSNGKVQWEFNRSHLRPKAGYLIGGKGGDGWRLAMVTKVDWMKALALGKKACTW